MATTSSVLQFRIELLGIEPLIWRRIQIPSDYTFWDLHVAIQSAFGWNDSHLHEFSVPQESGRSNKCFGLPTDEDDFRAPDDRPLPGWKHRVADYFQTPGKKAAYCYDFGDDWQHVMILEDILPSAPGKKYPRCIGGERAGPPDDCGGVSGYENLLEILTDRDHEEHDSSHTWAASIKGLRGKFDPEAFDEQRVKFENPARRLKTMLDATGW